MNKATPNHQQLDYWDGDVGRVWAEEQARLDQWLSAVNAPLFAAADPRPGERGLDVGCGAGDTTLALAGLTHPGGSSTGVDISGPLLARARARAVDRTDVSFVEIDAQTGTFTNDHDLILSRFGVMFFADPVAAFANLRTATRLGGRLAFACWQDAASNPVFKIPMQALSGLLPAAAPVDPYAPGPTALADDVRTRGLLTEAGWHTPTTIAHDIDMVVGKGDDPVADAVNLFMRIGPAAAAARDLGKDARPVIRERLTAALTPYATGRTVRLTGAVWIVTATN